MNIFFRIGCQKYKLVKWTEFPEDGDMLTFADKPAAFRFLARLVGGGNRTRDLRRLMRETGSSDCSRAKDCDVIDFFANRLVSGYFRIVRAPCDSWGAGGRSKGGMARQSANSQSADLESRSVGLASEKTWIEIEMLDESNRPVPNEPFMIFLPGGGQRRGVTDARGLARIEGIDPGNCQVTFTKLDKHAWKRSR